jgi:bifunctional oligoribonuclease and PAP phosphatase NrnA
MRSGGRVKVPHDLISFLKDEDYFLIATHINPDGDALGSALALAQALESSGKTVIVYDRDPVPEYYRFLPGQQNIIHSFRDIQSSSMNLVLLDCNSPDRTGMGDVRFKASCVIDHHETENNFGQIKWVEPHAAATGMLIFYLLRASGVEITREVALNLYTAIVVDTGAFRYSNTSAEVLRVSADLVEAGASPAFVSNSLYEMWSDRRFSLLIMALSTLEIRESVAFINVTSRMFQETETGPEDTENFPSFPRMMQRINVSVFLRQIDSIKWKVSLRSKGDINVAGVAMLFEGGGHKNAAGCTIKGDLKTAKETLFEAIAQIINRDS